MKKILTGLLLVCATVLSAQQLRFVMDETKDYIIPCHPNVTTTIEFPSEILALNGKGFTSSPRLSPGVFLVGFNPGSRMVSISPLTDREERNLNVVIEGKTIVLEFLPVPQENAKSRIQFIKSVALNPPPVVADGEAVVHSHASDVSRSSSPPSQKYAPVPPERLISAIDMHKLFVAQKPETMPDIVRLTPDVVVSLKDNSITDNGVFTVKLLSVVLHTKLDILTFAAEIQAGSENLRLNPEGISVRVGSRVWRAVTADLIPEMKAGQSQLAFFVITGTRYGTMASLWPDNQFDIFINRLGPAAKESRILFEDDTLLRQKAALAQKEPSRLRKVRVDENIPPQPKPAAATEEKPVEPVPVVAPPAALAPVEQAAPVVPAAHGPLPVESKPVETSVAPPAPPPVPPIQPAPVAPPVTVWKPVPATEVSPALTPRQSAVKRVIVPVTETPAPSADPAGPTPVMVAPIPVTSTVTPQATPQAASQPKQKYVDYFTAPDVDEAAPQK